MLADALGLAGRARGVFVAVAQGRVVAAEVLAAKAAGAFTGNLPVQLSSFVGRAVELAELATAMARSPLVTVTGPGGVGEDPAGAGGRGQPAAVVPRRRVAVRAAPGR